ncbi:uncharacterized protein [Panulirus ornatus]|uniref:uncharacterized protein n=1 Tax=Panulirus ornatus TaxID=150431 RepID=UPI003A83FC49
MADHTEDNDPFEEDIVFDEAGLLGGKMPRSRQQSTVGFLPTFMLFIRTVFLCIAFLGLGLCVSVSGGPLITLEVDVGIPVDTAFHTFTARSIGMLLGGVIGSLLFEVYNRQFLIFVSLIWVAVSVTVLPFMVPSAPWWTFTTTASLGIGLGFLFTGGNVLCLDLWGRQGGASLQALHFSFAVGAFIVPLIIQPFFVGLQQLELHSNLSDGQDLPTTDTTEILMLVRGLQDLDSAADSVGTNSFFDLESQSYEQIKNLTYPKEDMSRENSSLFNDTSNLNSSVKDMNFDNETSTSPTSPEITSVVPVTTEAVDISSTLKTPKMKPSYTDANILEPEGSVVWKKPQAVEHSKVKTDSPDAVESKKPSSDEVLTSQSPADIETSPVTTTQVETTVTTTVPVKVTTYPTQITQQAINGTSENLLHNASIPVEADVTTEKSEASSAAHSIPTTRPTSSSTTSTTVHTTLKVTTDTPVVSTPSPKLIDMDKYGIKFQDDDGSKNVQWLETDMTEDTKSLILDSNTMIDSAESIENDDDIKEDDVNVPEPELLDLKELVKNGGADSSTLENTVSDEPRKSDIPSLKHHLFKPGTFSNGSDENSPFLDNMAQRFKEYGVTKVHLAYICIGIFIILNALISVVILCHNPRETRSKQDDGNMSKMQKGRVILFTVIFSVFMFMAEALQGAVHHLLASSSTGTGLAVIQETKIDGQVLFWGLVCLVRFLCILVSGCLHVKPGKLLVISVLFSFIGSIFLAIGSFGKDDFLWGGIIFLALGLAPVLPTSLLWMAQYMRVTHRLCALMIILASFGNSITHSLLTRVTGNAHAFAYILVTISFVSLFFLFLSMCILYTAQHSKALNVPVGYQLASQHEEEDSVEFTPSGSVVFKPSDPRVQENGEAGQSLLID